MDRKAEQLKPLPNHVEQLIGRIETRRAVSSLATNRGPLGQRVETQAATARRTVLGS